MYVNVCHDNLQQYIDLIEKALVNIDEKYFRIKVEGILIFHIQTRRLHCC